MEPTRCKIVDFIINNALFLAIFSGILFLTLPSRTPSLRLSSSSYAVGARRNCDWWDCPEKLAADQRVFNKSILYLKPHKTGSETFKEILSRVGEYYGLTTQKELEWKLLGTTKEKRKALLNNQYDVLLRHSRYERGVTEKRIRGWDDGIFEPQEGSSTTPRELVRIVTTRNPIDRLFSHYFSQRRFKNFTPKRGFVPPGKLSEQEEISDFKEWLAGYTPSQQVFYHRDVAAWKGNIVEGKHILDGVDEVTDFYDHVIVTEVWQLSVCLFGFVERIHPSLMMLQKRNSNGRRARRFRTTTVIADRALYREVVKKIEYDFLLYNALLKKFNEKLMSVEGSQFGRYCDRVGELAGGK